MKDKHTTTRLTEDELTPNPSHSYTEGMDVPPAPIESLEEKTAKAFEEIASGNSPDMVVISAEEYANFQAMQELLLEIYNDESEDFRAQSKHYKSEIEKLLKQKFNP